MRQKSGLLKGILEKFCTKLSWTFFENLNFTSSRFKLINGIASYRLVKIRPFSTVINPDVKADRIFGVHLAQFLINSELGGKNFYPKDTAA